MSDKKSFHPLRNQRPTGFGQTNPQPEPSTQRRETNSIELYGLHTTLVVTCELIERSTSVDANVRIYPDEGNMIQIPGCKNLDHCISMLTELRDRVNAARVRVEARPEQRAQDNEEMAAQADGGSP